MRGTFAGGCTSAASGTASRLRVSVITHPMVLYHMVVSSSRSSANHHLFIGAERLTHQPRAACCASAACGGSAPLGHAPDKFRGGRQPPLHTSVTWRWKGNACHSSAMPQ